MTHRCLSQLQQAEHLDGLADACTAYPTWGALRRAREAGWTPTLRRSHPQHRELGREIEARGGNVFWTV